VRSSASVAGAEGDDGRPGDIGGRSGSSGNHHGERHVFGYLLEGSAAVEYGPGGRERIDGSAPGFFHVPPGVIHRDLNPDDETQVSVVTFVGPGPLVVTTDGPGVDD
jgi:uncharacterized RmlC-like cupin family protein